jgi:hypothetical protein
MNNYKAAAEKTDEAERLLISPFRKTLSQSERTELELRNQTVTMAKQIALLQNQNDKLNEELPKMRKENKRLMDFIQDAAAFLRHKRFWNDEIKLRTLIHDINGLANDEPCFSPRVTGYAKAEQETK